MLDVPLEICISLVIQYVRCKYFESLSILSKETQHKTHNTGECIFNGGWAVLETLYWLIDWLIN